MDGKSACNGPCATNWPALKAEASDAAGDGYTIITRDDGSKQWAHKGKPLYTFAKDTTPGDVRATDSSTAPGIWRCRKTLVPRTQQRCTLQRVRDTRVSYRSPSYTIS